MTELVLFYGIPLKGSGADPRQSNVKVLALHEQLEDTGCLLFTAKKENEIEYLLISEESCSSHYGFMASPNTMSLWNNQCPSYAKALVSGLAAIGLHSDFIGEALWYIGVRIDE